MLDTEGAEDFDAGKFVSAVRDVALDTLNTCLPDDDELFDHDESGIRFDGDCRGESSVGIGLNDGISNSFSIFPGEVWVDVLVFDVFELPNEKMPPMKLFLDSVFPWLATYLSCFASEFLVRKTVFPVVCDSGNLCNTTEHGIVNFFEDFKSSKDLAAFRIERVAPSALGLVDNGLVGAFFCISICFSLKDASVDQIDLYDDARFVGFDAVFATSRESDILGTTTVNDFLSFSLDFRGSSNATGFGRLLASMSSLFCDRSVRDVDFESSA